MSEIELSRENFEYFRGFVLDHSGIEAGDAVSYLVRARLARVASEAGCESHQSLIARLEKDPGSPLRDQVVEALVSDETLWFRDSGPWQILEQELLPSFCEELESGARSSVRIWCTSCATGQEPYSVAISILEHLSDSESPAVKAECFEITATDVSVSSLFVAMSGRYDGLTISRGLDPELRERYFEEDGRLWALSDRVRERVSFRRAGLMDSFEELGRFDLVLCRNVLTYFREETRSDILNRIGNAIRPKGYLLVGSSEALGSGRNLFETLRFDGHAYYRADAERKR